MLNQAAKSTRKPGHDESALRAFRKEYGWLYAVAALVAVLPSLGSWLLSQIHGGDEADARAFIAHLLYLIWPLACLAIASAMVNHAIRTKMEARSWGKAVAMLTTIAWRERWLHQLHQLHQRRDL